jgi:predicted dehydrogenase/threonine dehydrogenase-like Zn-dependent dehydrogenase
LEAASDVAGFAVGDRVVSNGKHAEIVVTPHTLCARVPDNVDDESAAFTVLGAIALQGVRLAKPTLGEAFVVTGLGIIGLLAVQLLLAHGCRVLGIDTEPDRLDAARRMGAETVDLSRGENPLDKAGHFSRGRGVDGVLLTLSTISSEPISEAARMCRKRGRIVLIGVAGLDINRADFYEKEISFQVSCSYGPGRYDPAYEERGLDYPFGYVRWTEQRNFEAVLDMMSAGHLNVSPLITHRFGIGEAATAYDVLASDEKSLGIVLTYPDGDEAEHQQKTATRVTLSPHAMPAPGSIGFIGAGNYGGRVLIKAFRDAGARLHTLVSSGGVSAAYLGRKLGFAVAASDATAALDTAEIDTICIATRHDSHAAYVCGALRAGKNVFVEKPLCLTLAELDEIAAEAGSHNTLLMVGFNRRFAPLVARMKDLLSDLDQPKIMVMTVNAGTIPATHWVQDPAIGGGRIVGEACHFIDLLRHLAAAPVKEMHVTSLNMPGGPPRSDNATITLHFENGAIGTVHYLANGHKSYPKERLEVFCGGRILVLDNFRKLTGFGWPNFSRIRVWRQDKGQKACVAAFVGAVKKGEPSPIPLEEILEVSRLAITAAT